MISKYSRNKYHNKKIIVDGFKFDSKKEANRYIKLKKMVDTEEISNLKLQPKYELQEKYINNKGEHIRAITYKADFEYLENDKLIIEDVKGMKTDVYKIKKKLLEYKIKDKKNVEFREV